jgi:hypothetical protein
MRLVDSLYIRGLAKTANGDAKGGREDIGAARKISRDIDDYYRDYGIKVR